jgi:uncharacterized NAD(P)/FAD-binding protein YdhS
MSPHKFGGIAVDTDSYCVIGADGKINSQLRAVGELTAGVFFFTSALDINARHARTCATQFATALEAVSNNLQAEQSVVTIELSDGFRQVSRQRLSGDANLAW